MPRQSVRGWQTNRLRKSSGCQESLGSWEAYSRFRRLFNLSTSVHSTSFHFITPLMIMGFSSTRSGKGRYIIPTRFLTLWPATLTFPPAQLLREGSLLLLQFPLTASQRLDNCDPEILLKARQHKRFATVERTPLRIPLQHAGKTNRCTGATD